MLRRVVSTQHDAVTDREAASADLDLGGEVEVASGGEELTGVPVEEAGLGSGAGEQECVAGCVQPVAEGEGVEIGGAVGEHDSAVVSVGGERGGDVAVTQLVEGGLFPRLLLAAVDDELGDPVAEGVEGGPKASTGLNLGQLPVVANQHDLGAGDRGLVDDGRELADACGPGFVDDDHGRDGDRPAFGEVAGDRRRCDAGAGLEFAGGTCHRSETDDVPPDVLVHPAEGAEGVGLAGSGSADEHGDPVAGGGQRSDRIRLVVTQRGGGDRLVHNCGVNNADAGVDALVELSQQLALHLDQRAGGVPQRPIVGERPVRTVRWAAFRPVVVDRHDLGGGQGPG